MKIEPCPGVVEFARNWFVLWIFNSPFFGAGSNSIDLLPSRVKQLFLYPSRVRLLFYNLISQYRKTSNWIQSEYHVGTNRELRTLIPISKSRAIIGEKYIERIKKPGTRINDGNRKTGSIPRTFSIDVEKSRICASVVSFSNCSSYLGYKGKVWCTRILTSPM